MTEEPKSNKRNFIFATDTVHSVASGNLLNFYINSPFLGLSPLLAKDLVPSSDSVFGMPYFP